MIANALGLHTLIELNGCPRALLGDSARVEHILNEAARAIGATIVRSVFHHFNPQGVSGVVVIAESHFAVHTWPEHGYAAVDLFTCSGKIDQKKAVNFIAEAFGASDFSSKTLERGVSQK